MKNVEIEELFVNLNINNKIVIYFVIYSLILSSLNCELIIFNFNSNIQKINLDLDKITRWI